MLQPQFRELRIVSIEGDEFRYLLRFPGETPGAWTEIHGKAKVGEPIDLRSDAEVEEDEKREREEAC